jgi:hypothetical protein
MCVTICQLDPGISSREFPIGTDLGLVALAFPGRDLLLQKLGSGNPTIQTLTLQNAKFALGHVEPATVLGGVVDL